MYKLEISNIGICRRQTYKKKKIVKNCAVKSIILILYKSKFGTSIEYVKEKLQNG